MSEDAKEEARIVKLEGFEDYTLGIPMFLAAGDGQVDLTKLEAPQSYVLTSDGLFLYSDTGLIRSFTPHDNGIMGLGEVESSVTFFLKAMPREKVAEILGFFQWVYDKYTTEVMVVPFYNSETKEWFLLCPEQEVTGGSIEYDLANEDIPKGFMRIGSIHSHAGMSAYHSSVDHGDEKDDDGFHMTIGEFTRSANMKPSLAASMVVGGKRFVVTPEDFFDWDFETIKKDAVVSGVGSWKEFKPSTTTVRFIVVAADDLSFPEDWKEKVKAKKVQSSVTYYPGYSTGGTGYISTADDPSCYVCTKSCAKWIAETVLMTVDGFRELEDEVGLAHFKDFMALGELFIHQRTSSTDSKVPANLNLMMEHVRSAMPTHPRILTAVDWKNLVMAYRCLRWPKIEGYFRAILEDGRTGNFCTENKSVLNTQEHTEVPCMVNGNAAEGCKQFQYMPSSEQTYFISKYNTYKEYCHSRDAKPKEQSAGRTTKRQGSESRIIVNDDDDYWPESDIKAGVFEEDRVNLTCGDCEEWSQAWMKPENVTCEKLKGMIGIDPFNRSLALNQVADSSDAATCEFFDYYLDNIEIID